MRNFCLVFIVFVSFSAGAQTCHVSKGAQQQYSRFFSLWLEDKKGDGSDYQLRAMTNNQKSEAWSCLIQSVESGGFSAAHVLELFYRFGAEEFGIEPDLKLADYYKRLKMERQSKDATK